jgi:hypothetical protein
MNGPFPPSPARSRDTDTAPGRSARCRPLPTHGDPFGASWPLLRTEPIAGAFPSMQQTVSSDFGSRRDSRDWRDQMRSEAVSTSSGQHTRSIASLRNPLLVNSLGVCGPCFGPNPSRASSFRCKRQWAQSLRRSPTCSVRVTKDAPKPFPTVPDGERARSRACRIGWPCRSPAFRRMSRPGGVTPGGVAPAPEAAAVPKLDFGPKPNQAPFTRCNPLWAWLLSRWASTSIDVTICVPRRFFDAPNPTSDLVASGVVSSDLQLAPRIAPACLHLQGDLIPCLFCASCAFTLNFLASLS